MKNILVVEDDSHLRTILLLALQDVAKCQGVSTLAAAYLALTEKKFDLILVDRVLPDGDGMELIEYLQDFSYKTKIVALTSQGTTLQRVEGLEKGADDYLPKPFSMAELKLKIKKLLKIDKLILEEYIRTGDLHFFPQKGQVVIAGLEVHLRKKEAQIFHCLLRYKNQVVTRETIISDVWAGSTVHPSQTTLDVYIRRVRVLLQEYSDLITTVRGFGYRLNTYKVAHK